MTISNTGYGLAPLDASNAAKENAALKWLREVEDGYGGQGLAPHRNGGATVKLIPKGVHRVQHTDMAVYAVGE